MAILGDNLRTKKIEKFELFLSEMFKNEPISKFGLHTRCFIPI